MLKKILCLLVFGMATPCFAQANVAELTQQGGQKMSKEELQQLHAGGVTMKGTLANGSQYSQRNKPDGTASGNASGSFGTTSLQGTWKIDDAGKLCIDVKTAGGNQLASCNFIWKAGEKYFGSPADTPDTVVRARQFEK